jgi:hypothetical protein
VKHNNRKLDNKTKLQRLKRYLNGENLADEVLEPVTRINFFLVASVEQKERMDKGLVKWVEESRWTGNGVEQVNYREEGTEDFIKISEGPSPFYVGGNNMTWEEIRCYDPEAKK